MRFDDHFLDELKTRLRPSDVIGKSVKLRRQGREYAGLSPFTKEKSPSFFVNDDKGFYHCFSSGKHGDIISYLQETERLTFTEAVERLAAEAGMALPEPDARAAQEDKKRSALTDWMETAAAWFESELRRPVGRAARDYLARRALPEDQWSRFRIGFAPNDRTALKDYLIAKGAKPAELIDAGLLIAPEDGGQPYDRFRDRIIFPITDTRGRVVSFGGRAMDPAARAKYLNGPETTLFHKGRLLYGLYEARKLLHAAQAAGPTDQVPLLVVEGYMDVIACQRAGLPAVAPMGTAMTEEQMEVLWRLHPEPTLSFDGDKAGQRAASRAIDRALPLLKPGRSFKFSMVTGGKDPDDVLREQGAAALKSQMAQTTPFVRALFQREREAAEPLETPEQRTNFKVRLRLLSGLIADKELAQEYKADLLDRWDEERASRRIQPDPSDLGRELVRHRWDKERKRRITERAGATPEGRLAAKKLRSAPSHFSAALAVAVLHQPKIVEGNIEKLVAQGLGDENLDKITNEAATLWMENGIDDESIIRNRIISLGITEDYLESIEARAREIPSLNYSGDLSKLKSLWSLAFEALIELSALERAIEEAKQDLTFGENYKVFVDLKTKRDIAKRMIETDEWQHLNQSLH